MLLEKAAELITAVAYIDDGADLPGHHHFEEVEQMRPIGVIEPVSWFIENEYFRHFDQRPGDQQQTLFTIAESAKRRFFQRRIWPTPTAYQRVFGTDRWNQKSLTR